MTELVAPFVPVHGSWTFLPDMNCLLDPSGCPVNSERAKSIVRNAESQLVNERIRLINSQLTALRAEYSRLTDWVKCGLPAELADTVSTHVLTVQENAFIKTKARHLQKFERFLDSKAI